MTINIDNSNVKVTESGERIEIAALYSLVTQNDNSRTVTGSVLYHNYLANSVNAPSVKSYARLEGAWFDVFLKGEKVFCVYALNEDDALDKRKEDLVNLGCTNSKDLRAELSQQQ